MLWSCLVDVIIHGRLSSVGCWGQLGLLCAGATVIQDLCHEQVACLALLIVCFLYANVPVHKAVGAWR